MNVAEEANLDPTFMNNGEVAYYLAKSAEEFAKDQEEVRLLSVEDLDMVTSQHFQSPVNLTESSVHVPTNVWVKSEFFFMKIF